ncbi:MAG: hypothetical protein H7337_06120 [Rhizobacter sp.]|nr:hypothetical protein [Rhizobacter sp.]
MSPLVARGLGIGFVDEMTAHHSKEAAFDVHRFRPRIAIPVCGVFVRDKPRARLAQAFITHALQYMQSRIARSDDKEDTA